MESNRLLEIKSFCVNVLLPSAGKCPWPHQIPYVPKEVIIAYVDLIDEVIALRGESNDYPRND